MTRKMDEQFENLAAGYFDQTLNRAGEQRLAELMREDDARVRRFAELAQLNQMIASEITYRKQAERFGLSHRPSDSGSAMVLSGLVGFDEQAPAPAGVDFAAWQSEQRHAAAREQTRKRMRVVSLAGIAALIVLAGVLAVVLISSSDQQPPLAEDDVQQVAVERTVARLTDQRDAVWQDSAGRAIELTTQDKLIAGQRVTLVRGFAELTTLHGAMARLEGPCTVELVDHDNALRLHAGRLVGICETALSKGFTVHSPHMDVIDLGTRFGVDVSEQGLTEVHVFEGEVQAARPGSVPVLLTTEQSARAVTGNGRIATIDHNPSRFAAIRDDSGLGIPQNKTALHTDTDGRQWLIAPSENPGPIEFNGNEIVCTVNHEGFERGIAQGNAYGFIQYQVACAGLGKPATAVGSWTLSNLPAGRYDVATAFEPKEGLYAGGSSIRYTVNGVGVEVDQSAIPAPDAGPTFTDGIRRFYQRRPKIDFTLISSSVVVPEGGSITITIDNANHPETSQALMDSIAISLVQEEKPK